MGLARRFQQISGLRLRYGKIPTHWSNRIVVTNHSVSGRSPDRPKADDHPTGHPEEDYETVECVETPVGSSGSQNGEGHTRDKDDPIVRAEPNHSVQTTV